MLYSTFKFFFLSIVITEFCFVNVQWNFLFAEDKQPALLSIGGGYMDTRKYGGSLLQIEYKYENIWKNLRPQATILFSQFNSGYIGLGFSLEYYLTEQIIIIPSFAPGLYWRGNGRDLGYPIEFQSAVEISYEFKNKARIGIHVSHLSNAHLSHHNPGFNAFMLWMAVPLKEFKENL